MSLSQTDSQQLGELIRSRRSGYSLPREFYSDELVFRADLDRIWRTGWLFVGHTCQVSQPGDYFTFEVGGDSLIVVRDDDDQIHAFHNLCRHRGTLLCDQSSGKISRFVCPYHQWTYTRDGSLASCRGMQEDLDKSQFGLHRAHLRQLQGMIFVSLAKEPPSFDEAADAMGAVAEHQGMERAKVAKIVDYQVAANWKLVWENNRECYHCNANHPQYIKANYDHFNADDTTERIQEKIAAATLRSEEKWAASGLSVTHKQTGMALFPDADRDLWYSANRTALTDGYVSETMDGRQAAPLMGDYQDADVGTMRVRTMPNFWNHSSCDHVVSTGLFPRGPQETSVRVIWLVNENAAEGKDYQLEEIMPFWQLTSEQDWQLCERAQQGVNSSRYEPGPYSTHKEYNVDGFVRWYLKQLKRE